MALYGPVARTLPQARFFFRVPFVLHNQIFRTLFLPFT